MSLGKLFLQGFYFLIQLMQVDICEYRRQDSTLRGPAIGGVQSPVLESAGISESRIAELKANPHNIYGEGFIDEFAVFDFLREHRQ